MRRRKFITLFGGAVAWPFAARAQQSGAMRRIGILMPFARQDAEPQARVQAFRQELTRLGSLDGSS
jgi:putative tryptophan/tyrosine transport system substrate-binding protein